MNSNIFILPKKGDFFSMLQQSKIQKIVSPCGFFQEKSKLVHALICFHLFYSV